MGGECGFIRCIRLLYSPEIAYVHLASQAHLKAKLLSCRAFRFEWIDARVSGRIVDVWASIPAVLLLVSLTQVTPSVIVRVTVDVIYLGRYLVAGHHLPNDAVDSSELSSDADLTMAAIVKSADLFAGVTRVVYSIFTRDGFSRFPDHGPGFGVVIEDSAKLFGGG
jgi:hypothetical protein